MEADLNNDSEKVRKKLLSLPSKDRTEYIKNLSETDFNELMNQLTPDDFLYFEHSDDYYQFPERMFFKKLDEVTAEIFISKYDQAKINQFNRIESME